MVRYFSVKLKDKPGRLTYVIPEDGDIVFIELIDKVNNTSSFFTKK